MSLLPRLRLLFARRPWLYWLLVGLCATIVWLQLSAAQARVDTARQRWGSTRRVWVASAAASPGAPVIARAHDYPAAMVPSAAVTALPGDAVAAHTLAAGEVLVATDVAGPSSAPAGWVVFAVPADGAPALLAGDKVSVFGSGQLWCDGVVHSVDGERADVAVPPDCAASVSAQLALDAVVLAVAS